MEDLRERAGVEHAAGAVDAAQRRHAELAVLELAVVVVLHDPAAPPRRPLDEREAPAEAHRDARGELVRGRHDGQPRLRVLPCRRDVQALVVHRHAAHAGALRDEVGADAEVARILDEHFVAIVEQQAADEVDRLLRAGGDHHLLGRARDAARHGQELRDRPAQRHVAGRMLVGSRGQPGARQRLPREPLPERERKGLQRRHADAEGSGLLRARAPRDLGARDAAPAARKIRVARRSAGAARAPGGGKAGGLLGNVGAVAHPRAEVALELQALHRPQHGVARDAEHLRVLARRRQPRAGLQRTARDGVAQAFVDLLSQRLAGGWDWHRCRA